MHEITTTVNIGAEKPFRLLHMSDTHLALCDSRDNERKNELARGRFQYFSEAENYLSHAVERANAEGIPLVHTGDLIDFVSKANLDRAKKLADEVDLFFAAGNHEFSLYVGEAFEDEAYRNISLADVQACFKNNIRFDSRKINGVNLIVIDDSYNRFDAEQLAFLKKEAELKLPIILFMHAPLYSPELFEIAMKRGDCAYVTAAPEELIRGYNEYRYKQQLADDITFETAEFIENCPYIKAIFTGHIHFDYEGTSKNGIPQFSNGIDTLRTVIVN